MKASRFKPETIGSILLAVLLISASGTAGYRFYRLYQQKTFFETWTSGLKAHVSSLSEDLAREKEKNAELSLSLDEAHGTNSDLSSALKSEQDKNTAFEGQILDISRTVGTLQKLSETDPELLKKYSRIYFLNENYAPVNLSAIDLQYVSNKNRPEMANSGIAGFLDGMLAAASGTGVPLRVVSAYRSFTEQAAVKTGYKILYGSGANQFSADQGYSEHQLGTTVDLTQDGLDGLTLNFEKSAGYQWLEENAFAYGFILSYPKGNTYYRFEPWHWRFVGVKLATELHSQGKNFYELTQREIDEHLISFFDR